MTLRITSTIPLRDAPHVNAPIVGGLTIGAIVETTDAQEQSIPPSLFAYAPSLEAWIALHIDHYSYTEVSHD